MVPSSGRWRSTPPGPTRYQHMRVRRRRRIKGHSGIERRVKSQTQRVDESFIWKRLGLVWSGFCAADEAVQQPGRVIFFLFYFFFFFCRMHQDRHTAWGASGKKKKCFLYFRDAVLCVLIPRSKQKRGKTMNCGLNAHQTLLQKGPKYCFKCY